MDSKKILVVDDEEDIVMVITYILMEQGYDVIALYTGEQVLTTIADTHPDLVLMDVMLGNMDGRAICASSKQQATVSLPVILISASHNLASSLSQPGAADDFVAKPFDIDTLLSKIEQQLAA